ncbi:conserved conjugative plasmid protein (plasmid) [Sulfolobus islandicus Y.N.15.51]|jgi:hypothetical protein|uniref:Conserved conjugative plasmid protein n=1 Tax=Saccharolobus islandicus (strain Y.N.15.51 / Yellowstone \|nr:hypothetical protein [Sulfolobus islandicus]ACP50083.1 conserved conjugative plasmid protein [Sulfolobus islandicus Y.N.15.51]
MLAIRSKDPEEIIELAKKYRAFPMELTLYINDPKIVAGLKSKRKVDVIKID